ncbi:hypothetical protein BN1221_04491c [Brenneria goodwinii]|uniref:Uncharacterized protein n=1 Tax=Brenneria goodwinii TaxID=1109412 RepID=A0A0G4K1I1_9GAMM|nr:hypothetical protein BN1221_04491c [Brenneria goodwinii]
MLSEALFFVFPFRLSCFFPMGKIPILVRKCDVGVNFAP